VCICVCVFVGWVCAQNWSKSAQEQRFKGKSVNNQVVIVTVYLLQIGIACTSGTQARAAAIYLNTGVSLSLFYVCISGKFMCLCVYVCFSGKFMCLCV
jgi:hypothetical protein